MKIFYSLIVALLAIDNVSAMKDQLENNNASPIPISAPIPGINVINEGEWDNILNNNQEQINLDIKNRGKKAKNNLRRQQQEEPKQNIRKIEFKEQKKNLEQKPEQEIIMESAEQEIEKWTQPTQAQRTEWIINQLAKNLRTSLSYANIFLLINNTINHLLEGSLIIPDEQEDNIQLIVIALTNLNNSLNQKFTEDEIFTFSGLMKKKKIPEALRHLEEVLSFHFKLLFDYYPDYLKEPNHEVDTSEIVLVRKLFEQRNQLMDLVKRIEK